MDASFFKQIQYSCHGEEISKLCAKLAQRCSFDLVIDVRRLCHLAYWLLVYEYEVEALVICRETHEVEFKGKDNFKIWDYILVIWGLEVYLLKRQGELAQAKTRIRGMDQIWMYQVNESMTTEKIKQFRKKEEKRRSKFTCEGVMGIEAIANCNSVEMERNCRLVALFHMIGYGSTGLFSDLEQHQEALDLAIHQYLGFLRMK